MFGRKRRKMYRFFSVLLFHRGYMLVKDDQLIFRCFDCKKSYKKDLNKESIKIRRFANMNFVIATLINVFCY